MSRDDGWQPLTENVLWTIFLRTNEATRVQLKANGDTVPRQVSDTPRVTTVNSHR